MVVRERCKRLEEEGRIGDSAEERGSREGGRSRERSVVRIQSDVEEERGEEESEEECSEGEDGRVATPQPDYHTGPAPGGQESRTPGGERERLEQVEPAVVRSGTLGERDVSQAEEVLVQALTISLDTFRQRYQQHPPPPADANWQLKEQKFTKSRLPAKPYFHKTERRLPKTPEPARRQELAGTSEQLERLLDGGAVRGSSDEEARTQQCNTMETVSTRSFGFSRPSGSFAARERERRLAQHRAQFVLQETPVGGHKMVHYRRAAGRERSEERTTTLARSKSMDMVAMANRTDENKRRLMRASSVTRLEEEDWREQTPFLRARRGGRRGDRTSWGLDEQGPIFQVAATALRSPPPAASTAGRRGHKWSPPPPVPTPDYPAVS